MFAVLEAARELRARERADFMYEMCAISAIPSQSVQYLKGLQSFYSDVRNSAVKEEKQNSQSTSVPWDIASQQMLAAMRLKKRLECRGG